MATSAATVASTAAAAAAARARRQVRQHFEDSDAFDPERAIGYEPPDRIHQRQFDYLVSRGIIRDAADGGYWIDRGALRLEEERHRRALKVLAVIIAVVIVVAVVAAAGIVLLIGS
jgi:hypothetical protein